MERIKNFFKDQSGASAVEYCLLAAMIAMGVSVAVGTLGTNLATKFDAVATTIGGS